MSAPPPDQAVNVRLTVAKQPTVAQGIMALLRAVTSTIYQSVDSGDPKGAKDLADHISADPGAWVDSVLANTPLASQTAGLGVQVPTYLGEAFATHGDQQARQDAANKAKAWADTGSDAVPDGPPAVSSAAANVQGKSPDEVVAEARDRLAAVRNRSTTPADAPPANY